MKTIWLFITNRCNLNCGYCYIKKNPKKIKTENAYKIIDKLLSDTFFNEHHVVLFGGEPLLEMELIKKIVKYGYNKADDLNKKITFSIYTNGTLMSDHNIKSLYNLKVGLDLSIDGVKNSQDQYRVFNNGKSSFETIVKKIPSLLKYYPYSMVNACITPSNVKYLSKNLIFFNSLGFKRIYMLPIASVKWSSKDLNTFKKELNKTFDEYNKIIKKQKKNSPYFNLLEDYIKKLQPANQKITIPCPAGIYNFAFSVDGEIFPCHRFITLETEKKFQKQKKNYKLGNINSDAINKKLYNHFINFNFKDNETCKKCEINKICCGFCHWEHYYKNQEYQKINTTVCDIQKTIVSEVKKFLKKHPQMSKINYFDKYKGLNLPK